MNYLNETILIVGGVVTAYTTWRLGGKQAMKNNTNDSLTRGTDAIIGTLERLIQIANENIETERKHRVGCEKALGEHKVMIDNLRKELNQIKKQIK